MGTATFFNAFDEMFLYYRGIGAVLYEEGVCLSRGFSRGSQRHNPSGIEAHNLSGFSHQIAACLSVCLALFPVNPRP
jgi:hypothetical protein